MKETREEWLRWYVLAVIVIVSECLLVAWLMKWI